MKHRFTNAHSELILIPLFTNQEPRNQLYKLHFKFNLTTIDNLISLVYFIICIQI